MVNSGYFCQRIYKLLSFILLISDFQNNSHKTGLLKTGILRTIPDSTIIDITHQIRLNNLIEAAFVIRETLPVVDSGSVLLVKVGASRNMLVYQHQGSLFILPDNGLIGMAFEAPDHRHMYRIPAGEEIKAIRAFSENGLHLLPPAGNNYVSMLNKTLQINGDIAVAECIFSDGHGNCYFNISETEFAEFTAKRNFAIRIQHYTGQIFKRIHRHISDVSPGEALFRFGSGGRLKLQINMGNARQLFRIKDDTKIIIERT